MRQPERAVRSAGAAGPATAHPLTPAGPRAGGRPLTTAIASLLHDRGTDDVIRYPDNRGSDDVDDPHHGAGDGGIRATIDDTTAAASHVSR